jgi:hypothetical protein
MKINLYPLAVLMAGMSLVSCSKENNYTEPRTVVVEDRVEVSTAQTNYNTLGLNNRSTFQYKLYSDGNMTYDAFTDSLQDQIIGATINLGNPLTEGPVLIDLKPRIRGPYISGAVFDLSQGMMDTLANNSIPKYFNIITSRLTNGLLRGQLNENIIFANNVGLTGAAVVPGTTTNTTGTAYLRVSENNTLYSKVDILNNDPTDPVTSVTINSGAPTANGPVVFTLVSSAAQIGTARTFNPSAAEIAALGSGPAYISVNTVKFPSGKIRGQIR